MVRQKLDRAIYAPFHGELLYGPLFFLKLSSQRNDFEVDQFFEILDLLESQGVLVLALLVLEDKCSRVIHMNYLLD